ncbi:MAG: hypothetical protein C0402_13900 [Thermodesulfovibrio sp.]|nr:hypothetical protein [Thermodesulfovibrio sp.]
MNTMMKYIAAVQLAAGIFLAAPSFTLPAYAEPDVKEGYDENTEITIKGTIATVSRGAKGPLVLRLTAAGKTYEIITAPGWYLDQEDISFAPGLELEVTGSKYFGSDGNIYVVSGRIRFASSEKEIRLRDIDYRPLWGGGKGRGRQPQK